MSSTAVVLVDIVGSKKIASQAGGLREIADLSGQMQKFLVGQLERLDVKRSTTITKLDSQGDDVKYSLQGDISNIANIAVGSVIAAFTRSSSGKRFRYVVYRMESDLDYQPRIKAFGDLSKTAQGKKHHIAIDGGVATALTDSETIKWLRAADHKRTTLRFRGESFTGVHVDLYCPINEFVDVADQTNSLQQDSPSATGKEVSTNNLGHPNALPQTEYDMPSGDEISNEPSRSEVAIAAWRRMRRHRGGF